MIQRCPITYDLLTEYEKIYSKKGLSLLSRNLATLEDFPYSQEEQIIQARTMATKMSIQGVQPKLSASLDVPNNTFRVTERGGTFIIKPQNYMWPHLPENEDLTMRLAKTIGLNVPLHGLLRCKDGSWSYFIRRFDRPNMKSPLKTKIPLEDFAQLSGATRHTKYNSTMEKIIKIIDQYCTFPAIEKEKLFKLTVFNYLVGNEDMHLKNYSLITIDGTTELAPCYDLLNTTVAMGKQVSEEIALPLNGKKNKLNKTDFIDYFAEDRLRLKPVVAAMILNDIHQQLDTWNDLISNSFLPDHFISEYLNLLKTRSLVFF
jgi:serine/threonine-protein kinase HipA